MTEITVTVRQFRGEANPEVEVDVDVALAHGWKYHDSPRCSDRRSREIGSMSWEPRPVPEVIPETDSYRTTAASGDHSWVCPVTDDTSIRSTLRRRSNRRSSRMSEPARLEEIAIPST